MASQNKAAAKPRVDLEQRNHQRQLRRNQIVFGILSAFLILSMILSLVKF